MVSFPHSWAWARPAGEAHKPAASVQQAREGPDHWWERRSLGGASFSVHLQFLQIARGIGANGRLGTPSPTKLLAPVAGWSADSRPRLVSGEVRGASCLSSMDEGGLVRCAECDREVDEFVGDL